MNVYGEIKRAAWLERNFKPARRGVLSPEEIELVRDKLNLAKLSDRNLTIQRNAVVRWFGDKIEVSQDNTRELFRLLDLLSGITYVIDREKVGRGLEV